MNWYRFQKVKNRNRTYFLSERELADALLVFIRGNLAYQWMQPRKLIEEFFNDEAGLEATMDYKTRVKVTDYLLDIVVIIRRKTTSQERIEF